MKNRKKHTTVDDYLADVPAEARRRLGHIRAIAKRIVPDAREVISYGIPAFRHGKVFLYFAAFKDHVSLFPPVPAKGGLARQLAPYRNAKGNLLFPLDKRFPVALVKQAVQALARQHAAPARKAKQPKLLAGGNPQVRKADGDAPVQAYIAAIPGWKRGTAQALDALITKAVPGVAKAVRWNSAMYGMPGQGWFASFHVFTHYVKLTFFKGTSLAPAPAGGSAREARWIDIHEGDLEEARLRRWVKQAAALPGWGGNPP